jgi:hypothetical protein
MNAAAIYSILAHVQARLNLIIIFTHIFKVMGLTAGAAGLLVMTAHLLGWPGASVFCWLLITLGGGLAGLVLSWAKRIRPARVAHWIDEQLHSYEALTAALICLERGCNGSIDRAIIERALLLASNKHVFEWPLKKLQKQAMICSGVCLGAILLLHAGLQCNFITKQTALSGLIKSKQTSASRVERNGNKTTFQTPGEIARALFPQDSELASLAETALNRGDIDAIKTLMKKSAMNFEEKTRDDPAISRQQHYKTARENARARTQLMQALSQYRLDQRLDDNLKSKNNIKTVNSAGQTNTGKRNRSEEQYQKINRNASNDTDSEQAIRKAKMNSSGAQNSQSLTGVNDFQKHGNGKNTLSGRSSEHSKRNWGEIKANANPPKPMIVKSKNGPVLEYIIPGKDLRIGVVQILPAARREAEVALTRRGVPGEYEDFIRLYFVKLSQKLTGQAPGNGDQNE